MEVKLQRFRFTRWKSLFDDSTATSMEPNDEGEWVNLSDLAPLLRLAVAVRKFEIGKWTWVWDGKDFPVDARDEILSALSAVEFEEEK